MKVTFKDAEALSQAVTALGRIVRQRSDFGYNPKPELTECMLVETIPNGVRFTTFNWVHFISCDVPADVDVVGEQAVLAFLAFKQLMGGLTYSQLSSAESTSLANRNILPFTNVKDVKVKANCGTCDGVGETSCGYCKRHNRSTCMACGGDGVSKCQTCNGSGGKTYTEKHLGDTRLTGMDKARPAVRRNPIKKQGLSELCDKPITLEFGEEHVTFESGDFSAKLPIPMPVDDYPALPPFEETERMLVRPSEIFNIDEDSQTLLSRLFGKKDEVLWHEETEASARVERDGKVFICRKTEDMAQTSVASQFISLDFGETLD